MTVGKEEELGLVTVGEGGGARPGDCGEGGGARPGGGGGGARSGDCRA